MSFSRPERSFTNVASTWLLLWGVLLTILGIFAIGATTLTTLITVFVIGALLCAAGIVMFIDSFAYWRGQWGGFVLHLIMALIYLLAGISLIEQPLLGSITFTLVLGIAFTAIGIVRSIYALYARNMRWGWTLLNGLLTLILGILILNNWPASSLYVIGLFVGIELIFVGFAYMMISMAAKSNA